jgi:catechol 2,3-dioxygenase-like lactoylglutathione lyase family enzyme
MVVKRIVANISADNIAAGRAFYADVLGMDVAMDMGWIMTFAADASMTPQLSVASEGGSGTAVPDLSIEVDDFDEVYRRTRAGGFAVEYGPVTDHGASDDSMSAILLDGWSIFSCMLPDEKELR